LDVARQLGRLVYPGFVARTGSRRLPDVARYLEAAARRIERLPSQPGVDVDRMRVIHELESLYRAKLDGLPEGAAPSPALREVPWLLEELRVASFAQGVGVKAGVSAKRVRRAIA